MANRYSQIFTLTDIFNNKKLKDKLPLINYKETELENGKVSRRTNAKTVNRLVFDIAESAARAYYKPMLSSRGGDIIVIGGTLVGDIDEAVDGIYSALVAKKSLIEYTANNGDMIRTALKEGMKNKRNNGVESKLYLKVQSMEQIEGMNDKQIRELLQDVMENIYYGDDFPQTQQKYGVEDLPVRSFFNYDTRKKMWKRKVGDT